MNRKQFLLLLVLVAVVGAAGLALRQRSSASWNQAAAAIGQKLLPHLPVNDITHITLTSGDGAVNLVKRDGLWRVRERSDYPAGFSQLSDLLLKFADLKVVQSEAVGPSQLGRFGALPPGSGPQGGTQVEFKDATGKLIASVRLGKKHLKKTAGESPGSDGWPDGRYVMVGTSSGTLALISDPLDSVSTAPAQWLDKDFLSIENPRTIAVQFPEPRQSWKLLRASATNDWQLAEAAPYETLDAGKLSLVTRPFSSSTFTDVAASDSLRQTNETVLTVETFDGINYVARIGHGTGTDSPVRLSLTSRLPGGRTPAPSETPEEKTRLDQEFKTQQTRLTERVAREKQFEKWVYQVPTASLEEILKTREQLLVEVQSTNAPAAPPP